MRNRVHRQSFLNHSARYIREKRAAVDRKRDKVSEALRHTAAWYALRAQVLSEAGHRCEYPKCRGSATVCDHKIPHRGDSALFFDRANLWALCKGHHDSKTATSDGGFGRAPDYARAAAAHSHAVRQHDDLSTAPRDPSGNYVIGEGGREKF